MATRRRLKNFAFWTAIAIPVLAAMYLGAYYRLVTSVTIVSVSAPSNVPMVQRQPRYYFPWKILARYNHAALQPGMERAFAPDRIDQWLRPDVWARREAVIQVQANGTGILVSE